MKKGLVVLTHSVFILNVIYASYNVMQTCGRRKFVLLSCQVIITSANFDVGFYVLSLLFVISKRDISKFCECTLIKTLHYSRPRLRKW